jgi:hypothetical protein
MNTQASNYFAEVQRNLDSMDHSTVLTADERDIVDDYEAQDFSPEACASHIAQCRL